MKNLTLLNLLIAAKFQVSEGSSFGWDSYGPDAHWIDCSNFKGFGLSPFWEMSIVIDRKNGFVYEVRLHDNNFDDYAKEKSWRWIHPKYRAAAKEEHKRRGYPYKQVTDTRNFIDYNEPEKIMKAIERVIKKHS